MKSPISLEASSGGSRGFYIVVFALTVAGMLLDQIVKLLEVEVGLVILEELARKVLEMMNV
jgi:hypothetical protein